VNPFPFVRPPPWGLDSEGTSGGESSKRKGEGSEGDHPTARAPVAGALASAEERTTRKAGTPSLRARPLPWSVRYAAKLSLKIEALGRSGETVGRGYIGSLITCGVDERTWA